MSARRSAISRTVVQAAMVSGAAPFVCMSDTPSAAQSCISRRASRPERGPRLASARSARPRHSTKSDCWNHRGTAAAVSATPIDASPPGEKAQSSPLRTLSISQP